MKEVLLTLGALTLGGSAAVLLLYCAGRSTRSRYTARWRCWGWLLLCLRLAVPLPLPSQVRAPIQMDLPNPPVYSPGSPGPSPSASPVSPAPGPQGGQPAPALPAQPSASAPAARPETELSWDLTYILAAVWLLGAAAMLAWNGWAHLRFLSYLRRWSAPAADGGVIHAFNRLGDQMGLGRRPRLLVCQGMKVPMLAGMLRPAILLPRGNLSGEELGFSLLHELTHYRRGDIWLKTLSMWVNALYWFNPLMWYMVRLVERDTELACDEDVLRRLSRSDYSAYGQTILSAAARLQGPERSKANES